MNDTTLFFSSRPAYPWSIYPLGLPALAVVAGLLVLFTLWTYLGHPQATRRRVLIVLALRLGALALTLLTAVRPSAGFQEEPKVPSTLVIGIDTSESMTVKDEVNSQARIDAVRKVLEKCQPLLDELAAEQNVNVVLYKFSTPDFNPETNRYDPKDPADGKRSDYGTYLNRTFDRWQGERFIRGHLLIGDGADNGAAFPAVGEAGRWGKRNVAVTTFLVGSQDSNSNAKDIAISALACDPVQPAIKTDVTVIARVNAYGFVGATVKARVFFNDKEQEAVEVQLTKERDNEIRIPTKAPPTPGEVKVRVEVGREVNGKIEALPGEVSPLNNVSETYLTVTKEGVRLLLIDRLRPELTRLRDALRAEKRFDVYEVVRQTNLPPGPEDAQLLDLDGQGYDVVVIGNVSYEQLASAGPGFPEKLLDRVINKGMGLMFLGGEQAYTGYPDPPAGPPKDRPFVFGDLLPVFPDPGVIVESVNPVTKRPAKTYQTVPTAKGLQDHVMKVDKEPEKAKQLWDELNLVSNRARITGFNKFVRPKGTAVVYAWATDAVSPVTAGTDIPKGADSLLVGHQIGEGDRGRVLAFAAYDTYMWERLGQPKTRQGVELHNRFWKQCVLWLAHQEEDEGQVYARPEFRRLAVGGDQTIRVGLKAPNGGDDPNAELDVRILPPGQDKPEDEEKAARQTVLKETKDGQVRSKVLFKPPAPGEYIVVVTSPMKDKDGKPMIGPDGKPQKYRGTARFLAFPDVSDEMMRVAADPGFFEKPAGVSGGKALRLEDLPGFLKELKGQPLETIKPKPRYLPDWRRNHSKGFLPGWLALFVALLGVEWGLRRYWGMV